MASTFRRRQSSSNGPASSSPSETTRASPRSKPLMTLPGTKAWTAGTTLVSTGLRELDLILSSSGGGQPLGSCIVMHEDRFTSIANTILRYWCAEALVHKQAVMIPVRHHKEIEDSVLPDQDEIQEQLLGRLPRSLNLIHFEEQEVAAPAPNDSTTAAALDTLKEEEEDDDDEHAVEADADEGLVVAWQYRSDVQQERLGLTRSARPQTAVGAKKQGQRSETTTNKQNVATAFCHSFDLNTNLNSQMNVNENVIMVPILVGPSLSEPTAFRFAQTLIQHISDLHERQPNRVIRVALIRVQLDIAAKSLPLILAHVRSAHIPIVIFITTSSFPTSCNASSAKWKRIVQRSADVVLEAESFVSRSLYPPPPEFRQFMGILKVHKASTATLAATTGHFADLTSQRRPAANVYGVKRDTRKLHLSLLHIPPEDFAAEGSSVGRRAERSGAGITPKQSSMGCATSGGRDSGGSGMVVPDF